MIPFPPPPPPPNWDDVVANWPIVQPGVESRYFSSHDRTGGNDDGFTGAHSELYVDARGEHVIFDAEGPGRLRTLWFTSESGGYDPLTIGKVRFYFDGEPKPSIEVEANQLYSGKVAPFLRPLVAGNHISTGGFPSWVPLSYAKRLRITTERRAFFYIAQYDRLSPDAEVTTWQKGGVAERLTRLFSGADKPFAGLEPLPQDGRLSGSGVIDALRFEPASKPDAAALQAARIRIWWNGDKAPAIDCPLGMFFGSGLGPAHVRALGFAMFEGAYENRFPMPYWKGARVQVDGIEGRLSAKLSPQRYDPKTAGTLRAVHNAEHPTTLGEDYTMLRIGGAGKLVGTVLLVEPGSPDNKQWWEGDLRCTVNGSRTPSLHGTGHEDDHLGGWSNEFLDTAFSLPMHGEPAVEMLSHEGQYNGNCSLYRLWPGINFVGGIWHSVEHGTENVRNYGYSSVTFYYGLDGLSLVESDRLQPASAESRKEHAFECADLGPSQELTSCFEGREYKKPLQFAHTAHSVAARFTLRLAPGTCGVWLRKVYDQAKGRQRAVVKVDGRTVGPWLLVEQNPWSRWAERDFYIPEAHVKGKRAVTVELVPSEDGPAWDAAEYRALCVVFAKP